MSDSKRFDVWLKRLTTTKFKIWQEESYLDGNRYTVAHIESVFDMLDLIMEFASLTGNIETLNMVANLDKEIRIYVGREEKDAS